MPVDRICLGVLSAHSHPLPSDYRRAATTHTDIGDASGRIVPPLRRSRPGRPTLVAVPPRVAVVQFPGTNCERETVRALQAHSDASVEVVWHGDALPPDRYSAVVLPGGFAYGDHLRAGAIARFSRVMQGVAEMARAGGLVLGICNGFQVLLEAGLLPGAMLRNAPQQFRSEWVCCRVERSDTPFTSACEVGQVLRLPIAHGEGNYVSLGDPSAVALRYSDADGNVTASANPNGSQDGIAGIINTQGNVFGLMPHPERAAEQLLGSADGRLVFESLAAALVAPALA
jgi:phosphoribosylformylglycinamidine synthase subunit PurQ / glutaminase